MWFTLCSWTCKIDRRFREQHHRDVENIRLQIAEASRLDQLGSQAIVNRQQILHDETSLRLTDQTQLIRTGLCEQDQHFSTVEQGITHIHESLTPVAFDVSNMSLALPQMVSSMSRVVCAISILALLARSLIASGSKT